MISGTNIPLPLHCNEWTLISDFDITNITPKSLEKELMVRVGRDYHGSSCIEHLSPFSAIYDLDIIKRIVSVCEIDYLCRYVDPRANGNILHAIVLNPNIEVIEYILSLLPIETITKLANTKNRHGNYPLLLIDRNMELFEYILSITNISDNELRRAAKYLPTACTYINNLDSQNNH